MPFTERDLQVVERHLSMLEGFVARQRKLVEGIAWPPEHKVQLERLLAQFETALHDTRERREKIVCELRRPREPDGPH